MLQYIVLFFAALFLDIYLLIEISGTFGILLVLAGITATGLFGAALIRREGLNVLRRLQTSVTGREVSRNMIEAVLILVGGGMLLLPGFITDFFGILMVLRPLRVRIAVKLEEKFNSNSNLQFTISRF